MVTNLLSYGNEKTIAENIEVQCTHDIYYQDAINIDRLQANSVDLVVTSPPYWTIKDYGNSSQVGFNDSIDDYLSRLSDIFSLCIKVLKPDRKLCINIGDQFLRASSKTSKVYQIVPLHSMIINTLLNKHIHDLVYLGSINWVKVSKSNTSGGGQIMGSYPYPRSGYFFVNREYIIIFRKVGKTRPDDKPTPEYKAASVLSLGEWREFFKDTWNMPPAPQDSHVAMFPEKLPTRLIKMYSFIGDVVMDPFLGSGTTTLAAAKTGRNSIGFEIGFQTKDGSDWKDLIKKKVSIHDHEYNVTHESKSSMSRVIHVDVHNKFRFHD